MLNLTTPIRIDFTGVTPSEIPWKGADLLGGVVLPLVDPVQNSQQLSGFVTKEIR